MSEHRILIMENPAHLSIDLGRLKISREASPDHHIAPDDIAVLLLHHPTISLTHSVITRLAKSGAMILSTDEKHLPCAMQIPLTSNVKQVPRLKAQIAFENSELSEVLWQQIVQSRLNSQAYLLDKSGSNAVNHLRRLANKVQPGDSGNLESQGARYFWQNCFGEPHKRTKQGAEDWINSELNFGYAVLRSLVIRTLVSAGLHPALGIHHNSTENPGNLADDLLEPYRFLVEQLVIHDPPSESISPERKQYLASIIKQTVKIDDTDYRLTSAIQESVDSYIRVLNNKAKRLSLPETSGH